MATNGMFSQHDGTTEIKLNSLSQTNMVDTVL